MGSLENLSLAHSFTIVAVLTHMRPLFPAQQCLQDQVVPMLHLAHCRKILSQIAILRHKRNE